MALSDSNRIYLKDVKLRKCLMCEKDFESHAKQHRRCSKCNERVNSWKASGLDEEMEMAHAVTLTTTGRESDFHEQVATTYGDNS